VDVRTGGRGWHAAAGGRVRARADEEEEEEKNETERKRTNYFLCNRWQWWVISPNSTKLKLVEYP
jgi:hypothetical protein